MGLRAVFLSLVIAGLLSGLSAHAQNAPRLIGKYRAWEAFVYKESGKQVCFILTDPSSTKPENVRRGQIYIVVTHRPADSVRDEVSVYVGYPLRDKTEASVTIGNKNFQLFTSGQSAWAYNSADDKAIVKAMVRGSDLIVKGTSQRGTATTDKYSLLGFTAARNAINKACAPA